MYTFFLNRYPHFVRPVLPPPLLLLYTLSADYITLLPPCERTIAGRVNMWKDKNKMITNEAENIPMELRVYKCLCMMRRKKMRKEGVRESEKVVAWVVLLPG
jgi:hypothetical protein